MSEDRSEARARTGANAAPTSVFGGGGMSEDRSEARARTGANAAPTNVTEVAA